MRLRLTGSRRGAWGTAVKWVLGLLFIAVAVFRSTLARQEHGVDLYPFLELSDYRSTWRTEGARDGGAWVYLHLGYEDTYQLTLSRADGTSTSSSGRWERIRVRTPGHAEARTVVRLYPNGKLPPAEAPPAEDAPAVGRGTWETAMPVNLRAVRVGEHLHLVPDFEPPTEWRGQRGLRREAPSADS